MLQKPCQLFFFCLFSTDGFLDVSQKLQKVLSFTSNAHLAQVCDFFQISRIAVLLDRQSTFMLSDGHSHIFVAVFEYIHDFFFVREAFFGGHEAIKTTLLFHRVLLDKQLNNIFKHHLFTRLLFERCHVSGLGFKLGPHIVGEVVVISDLLLHLGNLVLQCLHVGITLQLFLGLLKLLRKILLTVMGFLEKRGLFIDALNLVLEFMEERELKLFGLFSVLFNQSLILSFQFVVAVRQLLNLISLRLSGLDEFGFR